MAAQWLQALAAHQTVRGSPTVGVLLTRQPRCPPACPCPADSSRPFIVGDRIELKALSGSTIVAGV